MRPTLHLVPAAVWAATDPAAPYRAASLEREGFVHCTDGEDELISTANRHYGDDRRPFVVLTLDLDAVGAPWSIEDPRGIYPHVFGPIDRGAILAVRTLRRDAAGAWVTIGGPTEGDPPS
jgi:uncharacterized protein (DUF952 family)